MTNRKKKEIMRINEERMMKNKEWGTKKGTKEKNNEKWMKKK